jgi:ribonuclease P/MRP protein subunit POP5
MQVVGVSGTIKKAEEEAIRRAQAAILKAKSGTDGSVTMGLDAILGQPNAAPTIGHHKGRGEAMTGIEDEDDEDDEGTENNSDEND